MADITTSVPLGKPIVTASGSLVRLATGQVISSAQFQAQYDAAPAGAKPVIDKVLQCGQSGYVKLDDGRSITLPQFQKEVQEAADVPSSPTIASLLTNSYESIAIDAGNVQYLDALYIKP